MMNLFSRLSIALRPIEMRPHLSSGPLISQQAKLLTNPNRAYFSQFFEKQDFDDLYQYEGRKYKYHKYRALIDLWKKPLLKKQQRRQRMKPIREERKKNIPKNQPEKLVVHNAAVGIEYPPKPNQQFAIIKVDNFQYKVLEDTILVLDRKKDHDINQQIIFNEVLLYGTKSYTCVGRPFVTGTKVTAVIQSMSDSEKIIVFKKKRRNQYKKSFGSRIPLTMCRIIKIQHNIPEQVLEKAINLQ